MAEVSHVDPDVKVPAAVRAAAARSDELMRAQLGEQEVKADAKADPKADLPEPEPPADEPAKAAPAEAPAETPPTAPEKTVDWEHRYNSMKGRHDRLAEEISNLRNVITTLQMAPQPAKTEAPPAKTVRSVTPEEEELYGKDFLEVVGRRAKDEVNQDVAELKQEIADLKGRLASVGEHVVMDAREKMHTTLDRECADWREINLNPKFTEWLGLPDTYTGAIRHDLLKAAYGRNATPQVLAFFRGFLSEEAAGAPKDAKPGRQTIPLETFAAPGRAKTAAAQTPAEKPIFTRADITAFYVDVNSQKYRGREDEKKRIEEQIFEAQREGRIR